MATFQWDKRSLVFDCFAETREALLRIEGVTFVRNEISEPWLISKSAKYVEGNLLYTFEVENNSGNTRMATVTAYASDGTVATINVTQQANRIVVTPDTLLYEGTGGEQTINIKSNASWSATVTADDFWRVSEKTDTTAKITVGKNTTGTARNGKLILKDAQNHTTAIQINQKMYTGTTTDLGIVEIWKDKIIEYETDLPSAPYRITINGVEKYDGKAYKIPRESTIKINPNRIVENYVYAEANFDAVKGGQKRQEENTQLKDITVKIGVDTFKYIAINNWSYRTDYTVGEFNFPPSTKADARQFCPETKLVGKMLYTTWENLKDSTIYTQAPEDCNKRYVLYYNNLYAGWDALLFSGKYSRTDKLNRSTAKHATPNTSGQHYARQWNINVVESWKLKTDYLDEEGCRRMENVLTSNLVFLHDLDTDIIYPVNVTDTSYTEKNKYDKRRQRFYEINLERAIDMNRK